MLKYGIKLWTINKNCFNEAVDLCNRKQIDFIELYIVPDSFELKELEILKKIPVVLHTPHSAHNFNVFDLSEEKIKLFKKQVIETANFLNSEYIVFHAGVGSNPSVFRENYDKIKDNRIIIENMPKIGIDDKICFGYLLEQLRFIKKVFNTGLCLDINHAIKSAVSQKLDYKKYLELLIRELKPNYFHISNGKIDNEKDEHFNLKEGDFDLKWIKDILKELADKNDINLLFEIPKGDKGLENDLRNINYFKSI